MPDLESHPLDYLRIHLHDTLAVERYLAGSLEHHAEDERFMRYPEVVVLLPDIYALTVQHVTRLEEHTVHIGAANAWVELADVASTVASVLAGFYSRLRAEAISRMLRDDYTALNLAKVSYIILQTSALAAHEQPTADLASRHLSELAPYIARLGEVIPTAVARELHDSDSRLDGGAAKSAAGGVGA